MWPYDVSAKQYYQTTTPIFWQKKNKIRPINFVAKNFQKTNLIALYGKNTNKRKRS